MRKLTRALGLSSFFFACVVFAATHPLEPLSKKEIQLCTDLIKKDARYPKGALFPMVALREQPKADVLAFKAGQNVKREAEVIVLDRAANKMFEVRVDLGARKVLAFDEKKGQPLVLVEEYDTVHKVVSVDPRWQEAMKKRGFKNLKDLQVDAWAPSHLVPAEHKGKRLLKGITYYKGKDINFYGRVVEGVLALVDMSTQKVVDFTDTGEVTTPAVNVELSPKHTGQRKGLKPLIISQPQGVSFKISGNQLEWQNWRLRFNMHPREGLVLHQIAYHDKNEWRSILYRASLSEMVVPYGDPSSDWAWRNAFDVGEYGLGRLASSIAPGEDAPANAVLLDSVFSDDAGKAYVLPRAIGIYEKDDGFLWKHFDIYSGVNNSRRARSIVVFMIATIGNYDYALNWIFHQDGQINFEAQLSGIMLPKAVDAESVPCDCHNPFPSGHLVAKNVLAPHHQHFFNLRFDFDIDGIENTLAEMNTRAAERSSDNPQRNGIVMDSEYLKNEKSARRSVSMPDARKWKVISKERKNALGYRSAYAIQPEGNSVPYLAVDSGVRKRATFLEGHFWGTLLKENERYGAGEYPNQSDPNTLSGLGQFVDDNEELENKDVVVWYTFGVTHTPRPEEWPIMNVHKGGVTLLPVAFFDQNPALDVPAVKTKK